MDHDSSSDVWTAGAARRHNAATLQEQLDSALPLVCWSYVAAKSGLQLDMIDALMDAGATPASNADNALVNGHFDAAVRLLERGGMLTLGAAVWSSPFGGSNPMAVGRT